MPEPTVTPVAVSALVRGSEITGEGVLLIEPDAVAVRIAGRKDPMVRVTFDEIEGVRRVRDELVIFIVDGDVIEARGETGAIGAASRDILALACALPELTRALRAFGGGRIPDPDGFHDRFIAPLLASRRRAERAGDLRGQLAAFEVRALRTALHEVLAGVARGRCPDSEPDRRALEAELLEHFDLVEMALAAVEGAARAVEEAPDETRVLAWREWAWALRSLFTYADDCLVAMTVALADWPAPKEPAPRQERGGGGK